YGVMAAVSTLFVTKDEPVHARLCGPLEQWLHAVLFVLHPIVLAAFALLWWTGHPGVLAVPLAVVIAFGAYQLVYWNVVRREPYRAGGTHIDNRWYADLGARWYDADDTPIALLRAEGRHRN